MSPRSEESRNIRVNSPTLTNTGNKMLKVSDKKKSPMEIGAKVVTIDELMDRFGGMLDERLESKLDAKLDILATKDDLVSLKSEINSLKNDNVDLKEEVTSWKHKYNRICDEVTYIECKSRRSNLIFKGVKVSDNVDDAQSVRKFCNEVLGIGEKMKINYVIRLGKSENPERPLLCSFASLPDVQKILNRTRKLAGTEYGVRQDYPVNIRKKRFKMMAIRREILKHDRTLKAKMGLNCMYVEDVRFTWEEGKGLMFGQENGATKLCAIINKDLSGFLTKLLEEDNQVEESDKK